MRQQMFTEGQRLTLVFGQVLIIEILVTHGIDASTVDFPKTGQMLADQVMDVMAHDLPDARFIAYQARVIPFDHRAVFEFNPPLTGSIRLEVNEVAKLALIAVGKTPEEWVVNVDDPINIDQVINDDESVEVEFNEREVDWLHFQRYLRTREQSSTPIEVSMEALVDAWALIDLWERSSALAREGVDNG